MARWSYPQRSAEPLPAPLPPETRTVGQLVAETLRLYGANFWRAIAIGVLPGTLTIVGALLPPTARYTVTPTLGAAVLSISFVGAACIAVGRRPPPHTLLTAFLCGLVTFVPVPFLIVIFILPALAWMALVMLSVPAAIAEELPLRAALARGVQLARVDYVHVLGALATVAILALLSQTMLFLLLRGAGDATLWAASFLASLVVAPLILLGSALVYVDQRARYEAKMQRRP
jgi:hypothetical protein